jgi:hypothetical protein
MKCDSTITEKEFTSQVIQLARLFGWRVSHFRPAQTRHGWRTAVSGDGAGFPDLVMVRGGRMIVAELKVGRNKATAEQNRWLDAFRAVPGCRVYLWFPCDWPMIERVLMAKE